MVTFILTYALWVVYGAGVLIFTLIYWNELTELAAGEGEVLESLEAAAAPAAGALCLMAAALALAAWPLMLLMALLCWKGLKRKGGG